MVYLTNSTFDIAFAPNQVLGAQSTVNPLRARCVYTTCIRTFYICGQPGTFSISSRYYFDPQIMAILRKYTHLAAGKVHNLQPGMQRVSGPRGVKIVFA